MQMSNRRAMLTAVYGAGFIFSTGLAGRAFAAAKIKPSVTSALLVVDVQNCFVTGGTLPVKGGEEVVPIINKLASSFENIVVTQDWHTPGHASFASAQIGRAHV